MRGLPLFLGVYGPAAVGVTGILQPGPHRRPVGDGSYWPPQTSQIRFARATPMARRSSVVVTLLAMPHLRAFLAELRATKPGHLVRDSLQQVGALGTSGLPQMFELFDQVGRGVPLLGVGAIFLRTGVYQPSDLIVT